MTLDEEIDAAIANALNQATDPLKLRLEVRGLVAEVEFKNAAVLPGDLRAWRQLIKDTILKGSPA